MLDNQLKFLAFIFFIFLSSVQCKNNQIPFDGDHYSDDRNNAVKHGLFNERMFLPSNRLDIYKSKIYNLLNQPSNKPTDEGVINYDKNQYSIDENTEQGYRSGLSDLRDQQISFDSNNDPYRLILRSLNSPSVSMDENLSNKNEEERMISDENLKNLRNMIANKFLSNEAIISEKARRSGKSKSKRLSTEYRPYVMNFLDKDFSSAFRRNFYTTKKENSKENQSEEILELIDNKPKKALKYESLINDDKKQGKKEGEIKAENKLAAKLISNNNKSISNNLASSLRKNKWNRVQKSTSSFLGNNVSDCIKKCLSQGSLHPVQCHSLC